VPFLAEAVRGGPDGNGLAEAKPLLMMRVVDAVI
jgi:hypothetical protein